MHAVELNEVSARYRSRAAPSEDQVDRLHEVSLTLDEGELCALLGPNGAGKSTLIRVVAGVLEAHAGRLELLGRPTNELSRAERARTVAVVPQRSEVSLGFTVREVVAMGRAPHQTGLLRTTSKDRDAIDRAIETSRLGALADRPVAELSGGEQKRVHIARALAQSAPILLLDEAAAHLDIRHSIALYRLIREEVSARSLACLAAMHDLGAAAHFANRVVLLKDGVVVADGTVDEVMTTELLSETFGAEIDVGRLADGRRYVLPRI
ncbi:MAG: ABC transporter ATP-binding protein [Deltaproteobacteria bacterium]|nr:ABC transporter ATP-binding protein [Deltaproteobacteria bacterium]